MDVVAMGIANRTSSVHARKWCSRASATVVVGDFTGNGYDDAMCYDDKGQHWIVDDSIFVHKIIGGSCDGSYWLGSPKYLENMTGWCTHAGANRHFADFNGDGRTDVLCHDSMGNFSIRLAVGDRNFGLPWERPLKWCGGPNGTLHTGDFNGDKHADVLCLDKAFRKIWVRTAEAKTFFGETDTWTYEQSWCFNPGAELYVADFNGDMRDDILCRIEGSKWIAYAEISGAAFIEFNMGSYTRFDDFCVAPEDYVTVGYLNEDRYADMICHAKSGATTTHINHPTSRFDLPFSQPFSFCPGETSRLLVGRFINSKAQQLLCATNPEWKIISDFDLT